MKKNKILIITGGTGGHVIPAINFFNYLKNNSKNVFLITDNRGYQYISNIDKKNILKIHSSHLTGNISFKLLGLIKLLIGFLQSLFIYIKLRPTTIVSFGSYASFTPLICFVFFKFFFKTKLYLHEQNSLIGQTNRFFSKYANKIFVNFDKEYPGLNKHKNKIFVVGLPQKKISENSNYKKKKSENNINFLIFAGSQGSLDIINFFSRITNEIKKIFTKCSTDTGTSIFLESSHRLTATLNIIDSLFGNQANICIAKEISKIHERFLRGTAGEILLNFNQDKSLLKGEFILMLNFLSLEEDTSVADKLFENLKGKLSNKELAKLSYEITGINKNFLYERFLSFSKKS